jgi:DNA-binding NarL/FixJ family response regulator
MIRRVRNRGEMSIRILLADDHEIVAQAVAGLLNARAGLEVVGIATSGREAVELAEALRPDVVVMDAVMPDLSGMEATQQILSRLPEARVLALSAYGNTEFVEGMKRSGASGYLLKHRAPDELTEAIRAVHTSGTYPGRGAESRRWKAGKGPRPSPTRKTAAALSDRERGILRLVSEGKSSLEIASLLGLSRHTVVRHRQNIMDKLDVHSIAGLTRLAVRDHITAP